MKILFLFFLLIPFSNVAFAQTKYFHAGHTHDILKVKFSPDDSQLISYSAGDGRLILWDIKSGYFIWVTKTSFVQKADESYALREFGWSEDRKFIVTKSANGTYQTWDATTGKILEVSEQQPDIAVISEGNEEISVTKDYVNFYLSYPETKDKFTIKQFSRTGSVYDISHDGSLFAEGGSWGSAAIKITEIKTGQSRLLAGKVSSQRILSYEPNELETRLTEEKQRRRGLLYEAKAVRDQQAEIDTAKFRKLVYITFEHFGEMIDPGELRMIESSEPNKSEVKKSEADANAIWLRLRNDSPLPIEIPTQSMYLSDPKCFFEFPNGKKISGLCDGREISIWHGLENKKGKHLPYGFDFGSSAVLLPKTSVLFSVPLEIMKGGNAILFDYTFQNENGADKADDYGANITLKFRESDLPKTR